MLSPQKEKRPRVELTMVGDWGTANFHTVLGWISAHMRWRCAPRSKFTVRTGSAYREGIELVASGDADLAITTPVHVGVRWAYEGCHFYAGQPKTHLRTLGRLPQDRPPDVCGARRHQSAQLRRSASASPRCTSPRRCATKTTCAAT
jgi:hypothetical protein